MLIPGLSTAPDSTLLEKMRLLLNPKSATFAINFFPESSVVNFENLI